MYTLLPQETADFQSGTDDECVASFATPSLSRKRVDHTARQLQRRRTHDRELIRLIDPVPTRDILAK